MNKVKPSLSKGTRDFSPEIMVNRNYIFNILKSTFCKYGYMPLETPSMENLSTLLGKYGDEGDKLIFKILNSGNYLSKTEEKDFKELNELTSKITEKGLRYDLTVPFARYVAMNRNNITFPFKRYQMQPVWRADRPQKGRYREFYQCDIDAIGTKSLLNEAELIMVINDVFKKLGLKVVIKLNNRKILSSIAEYIGHPDKIIDITVAIDKTEKIGIEKVKEEMLISGINKEAIEKLSPIISLQGSNTDKLQVLSTLLNNEDGKQGIAEIEELLEYINSCNDLQFDCELDLTLARGLNYYTGAIFEVKALDVNIGSICGGGRYDELTAIFGLANVSGVGISFGMERIYDVMTELNLFPKSSSETTQVLFLNLGKEEAKYCMPIIQELRSKNINTELYPDNIKIGKQMSYADKKHISKVVIIGENEIKTGTLTIKDMDSGEQQSLPSTELIAMLSRS